MANIIDYLKKYGNLSFQEEKFNELDAAIFSRLSYIDYSSLINSRKYFSKKNLLALSENLLSLHDNSRFRLDEDNILLQTVTTSRRYKDIFIRSYVKQTNQEQVKQFSAVTFFNKNKKIPFIIISFRGTDGTYTGWKEDFEMCYKTSVPAQDEAKKYLLKNTRFLFRKKVIIVGHSKGGNLAIYSATFLNPKKIENIFAFDSPGFNKSFLANSNYLKIKDYIKSYLPQTSIIGRLLYSDYPYEIVDQKIEFVESLFSVIKEMSEDDVIQFEDSIFSFVLRFSKILKSKSDETKRLIFSIFRKSKEEDQIKKVEPIKNKKKFFDSFFEKFRDKKENDLPIIDNEIDN